MYYVLNSLEAAYTTAEKSFAIFADFTRDVILGLVASLITTIQMSVSSDDAETNLKLTRLKTWLREKRLPKGFQVHSRVCHWGSPYVDAQHTGCGPFR
eukprot:COSAG05_NODE_1663_length_4312_cov_16.465243_3_plen_98_part_00